MATTLLDPARARRGGQPPRRRRRRTIAAALAVVAVAAVVATTLVVTRGDGGAASVAASGSASFAAVDAYHVTYAVTGTGSAQIPGASMTTEQLWVRRPFESVDVTLDGPPPGNTAYLTMVNRLGAQVLQSGNDQTIQLRVPAAAAPQDVRADVLIPAGLRAGLVEREGTAVVAGHPCQVFRTAASLRAGPLPPLTSDKRYTDTCLDANGIVLQERNVDHGRLLSQRRAVSVSTGAGSVAGAPFDLPGAPQPTNSGGGAFRALTLSSRPPGGSWALLHPPTGFRHVGRYAVIPPQPQAAAASGLGSAPQAGLITEMDDVFVRGGDVIVVQQGATLNGAEFKPPPNAQSVDAGIVGSGQLQLGASMVTVTAEPYGGRRFVRVSATLPPDDVVTLARSLVAQPGGTLTRLDGTGR